MINSGKRNKLRRSHFNGLTIKVTKSQQMTTFNLRINKVQVIKLLYKMDEFIIIIKKRKGENK